MEAENSIKELDTTREKERLEIVKNWYESYSKTVSFIATIAASMLVISATYVLRDTVDSPELQEKLRPVVFLFLGPSWFFLLVSAVLGVLARVATYKWYSGAVGEYIQRVFKSEDDADDYTCDSFSYTEPSTMRKWGKRSADYGLYSGISLAVGVLFFLGAVIEALFRLFAPSL